MKGIVRKTVALFCWCVCCAVVDRAWAMLCAESLMVCAIMCFVLATGWDWLAEAYS